jgi:hypothetical protein
MPLILEPIMLIPKSLKLSNVLSSLLQILLDSLQFIGVGAYPQRTILQIEGLYGESFHLLHFLVFLHLLLVILDLLHFFLYLVLQLDAPELLKLVHLLLIQFYLGIHLLYLRVKFLHLLLEQVQSVLVGRIQRFFLLLRLILLLGHNIGQSLCECLDLRLQLFVLMLVFIQHLLQAQFLLVAFLLIFAAGLVVLAAFLIHALIL